MFARKWFLPLLTLVFAFSNAEAFQSRAAFETEHFAIYEVILEDYEQTSPEFWNRLIAEFTAENDLKNHYQSSVVVFPKGSAGFGGKINEPMLGSITIASYAEGPGQAVYNDNEKYATFAGLNLNFKMLTNFVDNKLLNNLLNELPNLPLVVRDLPVTLKSTDYQNSLFITSANKAVILDLKVIDSVFYSKAQMAAVTEQCTVDALIIVDRMLPGIPLFISGHGALNNISCQ